MVFFVVSLGELSDMEMLQVTGCELGIMNYRLSITN